MRQAGTLLRNTRTPPNATVRDQTLQNATDFDSGAGYVRACNAEGHRDDRDRKRDYESRGGDELGKCAITALERPIALDRMRKPDPGDECRGHGFHLVTNHHTPIFASDTGGRSATLGQSG